MTLTRFSIGRPTAVAMLYLAVLFTGLFSLSRLPLELTPEVDFPKLSVVTYWPDSSPEAVEAFITAPIEAVANTITNVRKVDSISEEGESTVNIEFLRGTDMDFAAMELNEKLSVIREELPYGAYPPQIRKYVPKEFQTGDFLRYHFTGNYTLQEIRRIALEKLKIPLMSVEGVADVQILGGQDREIRILLIPDKLRALGISETQVAEVLRDLNLRLTAGKIFQNQKKFHIIIDNPLTDVEEIEDAIITADRGRLIRIKDIAVVEDTYGEPKTITRINGNPEVVINIQREPGTNVIKVADRVFAKLEELKKRLPPGLELLKETDQSEKIRKELSRLASRAAICIGAIFLVLLLFLRNFNTPLIILSTIFFSVLLTINLFYIAKVGLNLLTLAGLALGFGMLVDNSIVVLDNIYRHRQLGENILDASERGTSEVALPVVASTLTTVAAFIPFLYLTGELRLYYLPFTMAVGLSLLSSLLVAFTLTPSISAKVFARKGIRDVKASTLPETLYQRVIHQVLHHKILTLFLAALVFAGSFFLFNKYVTKGRIFAWGRDTYLRINIHMPPGSEIERTDAIARFFEEKLLGNENLKAVYTYVSDEYGYIIILFPEELETTAVPLILKEQLTNLANQFAGAEVRVWGFGPSFYGGGGAAPNFRIKVLGYNYNEVKRIAEELGERLSRNPRVRDIDTNSWWWWRSDIFEIVLRVNREKLARFDLSSSHLLVLLQNYLKENLQWQRIKIAGKEVEYRIKMKGHRQFSLRDLENLLISTPKGEKVRLKDVAYISQRRVIPRIVRENQQYQRMVSFEYRGPWKLGDKLVKSIIKTTQLPPGYKLERGIFYFLQEKEKKQIYFVLALSILLVYMVTAALFESLLHPFVIILTVPLALIGVFLIFFLTDTPFDRSAYIGVILLGGIVVNNSIILVHHINSLRRKGLGVLDAVIQGSKDRLRPILMTTATTVIGLLPLVLFTKEESIWYSLALATIGGLLSSTTMVLTVIPCVYLVFERLKSGIRRLAISEN